KVSMMSPNTRPPCPRSEQGEGWGEGLRSLEGAAPPHPDCASRNPTSPRWGEVKPQTNNRFKNNQQGGSMSWQPSNDPILGDPKSCDALELVIVPRTRDLGDGFEVRRALPHGRRQMVGPFIFFDHFGPVQFMSGKGMDVRPHPHIGLATVT